MSHTCMCAQVDANWNLCIFNSTCPIYIKENITKLQAFFFFFFFFFKCKTEKTFLSKFLSDTFKILAFANIQTTSSYSYYCWTRRAWGMASWAETAMVCNLQSGEINWAFSSMEILLIRPSRISPRSSPSTHSWISALTSNLFSQIRSHNG